MLTTVAILNEKSFDQGSRLVLSSYMCVDSGGQALVVGGDRNSASLAPSFRVRDRELEGNPASLALSFRVRGRELEGKR